MPGTKQAARRPDRMKVLGRKRGALVAPAELTIRQAEALREDLLSALKGPGPVTLALGAVERLDTAVAQLLLAARRRAGAAGLVLADPSPACRETVSRLGLEAALFDVAKEGKHDG